MKTTSYEISRRLWEIGFKAEMLGNFRYAGDIPCFDLETILEALPSRINLENKDTSCKINLSFDSIRYGANYFLVKREKNESLADTAAKLLLELHKRGLVTFNQSTNNTNDNE